MRKADYTRLLNELKNNTDKLKITTIQGDLIDFDKSIRNGVELIVCMTDTILHLQSRQDVKSLFTNAFSVLEPEGKFILTFRDLTYELTDTDRFLPVRSDENIIFTCFLEYEPETVKVHDIVYKKSQGEWTLYKSFYRKLRLTKEWVERQLSKTGFNIVYSTAANGAITVIGSK